MRLYPPDESRKYITKVDMAGGVFEYEGEKDFGVYTGYYPIPLELAQEVINDIKFPLKWLGIPLFLLPFRLMVYDKGWTGLEYNGRAYPTHIVYGARKEKPTKESIGALIVHEIGHALCYKFVDPCYVDFRETSKFEEYRRLRGIPDHWTDKSHFWSRRPSEVWAEDFRYLFGPDYARQEEFLHYGSVELDPPKEEIREFMLSLLLEGSGKVKNKPEKIIIHHSLTEDNEVLKDYNAIKRYHTKVKGWNNIGYHWVLEKVGGRYHWIPGRSEKEVGAHCKEQGMNYKSIGICVVGNFDKEIPSEEIYKLVAAKCNEIRKRYPNIGIEDIEPHSKYAAYKSCPGKNFDIRKVKEYMKAQNSFVGKKVNREIPIVLDGKELDAKAIVIEMEDGGHSFGHIRKVFEALGFKVGYDGRVLLESPKGWK